MMPYEQIDDGLGQWGAIVGAVLQAGSAAYAAKAQKSAAAAGAKAQKEIAQMQANIEKEKLKLMARQSSGPTLMGGGGSSFPTGAVIALGGIGLLAVLLVVLKKRK